MSQRATVYYQERADIWGLEMHSTLDGQSRRILGPADHSSALQVVVDGISEAITPIEPFLIGGIPGVFEARGQHLGQREWERLQDLPRNRRLHTIAEHAGRVVAPELIDRLPAKGAVYLEALSWREAADEMASAWQRTTGQVSNPPLPNEDTAQAFFLTRTMNEFELCTSAMLTIGWAMYFDGRHVTLGERPYRESITPRYVSALLLESEVANLPPLLKA